jgi:2-hydroxy-6-oxonona-2,4-dienedioate hydrolase
MFSTLSKPQRTTPIVMLHGMFGGPENWRAIIPHLPRNWYPLIPRIPFFDNEIPLNSISAVVDYVQSYLNNIDSNHVVLMGNSLGGHIAALLAVNIPEQVRGLVLTGSSGLFERGFSKVPGTHPHREWIYAKCCEVFFDSCHVTDALVQSVLEVVYDRRKAKILIQLAKSAKRDNIAEKLAQIICPTLLIWGKQDQITHHEVASEFHRSISNSVLVFLDNCGHVPMMEHPAKFGRVVVRWWVNCNRKDLTL